LAFRNLGDGDSTRADNKDEGNFLALIGLISDLDPTLKEHLDRHKDGAKGRATYLSPVMQNEYIVLSAESVREKLAADVMESNDLCVILPRMFHMRISIL